MSRKQRGALLIILGFLLVFIATGIFMVNDYQDKKAGENAAALLEKLKEKQLTSYVDTDSAAGDMPQQTFMGYNLVGTITVPKCGIDLPVLNEWSYELLKISPCRYSGSVENNDLIILGHNYRSHFSPLKSCSVGDRVCFTDVNGIEYTYTVSAVEKLYKTELDKLTSPDYDLTVFTCTTGGQSRFVVRCSRTEE